VSNVFPVAGQDAQIRGNGLTSYAKINIVSPNFFSLEGMTVSEGSLFKEGENDKMVISVAALQLLNIQTEDYSGMEISVLLGEKMPSENNQSNTETNNSPENQAVLLSDMRYTEKTYKIVGVIDDISKAYLYIPDSSVTEMKFDNYEKLKVKINSTNNLEESRTKIIEKGFFVSSVSETVEQARQIFTIAQIILSLFGIVALVVSAIGMFNTMTIALLERTQEIGIMKSIGASSYDIWRMFLTESMLIGFFGGFTGVGFGFSLSQITNFGINWLAKSFGGSEVQLFFIPIWFVFFVISFSTIVGVITGFYPAKRAASLNALEALRYK
jgi:ABC-type antimicrobial peptide transport system permease subunit